MWYISSLYFLKNQYMLALVCFSVAMVNPGQNPLGGGEGSFGLKVTMHHQGKPKQELTAGTGRQELKEKWGMMPLVAFPCISYTAQAFLFSDGTTQEGSALSKPAAVKKTSPQTCPQTSLIEAVLQLGFFPSDSIRVKLTKLTNPKPQLCCET